MQRLQYKTPDISMMFILEQSVAQYNIVYHAEVGPARVLLWQLQKKMGLSVKVLQKQSCGWHFYETESEICAGWGL